MNNRSTDALSQHRHFAGLALRRHIARVHQDLLARWAVLRSGQEPCLRCGSVVSGLDLSVHELDRILAAARTHGGSYGSTDSALIEAATTSRRLRLNELLALRWGDFDWAESIVNVERVLLDRELRFPKCGRSRKVRLAPHTRRTLLRHRASLSAHGPEDLVFPDPTKGGFLDVPSLCRRLQAALERAGFRAIAYGHLAMAFKAPWWSRYL